MQAVNQCRVKSKSWVEIEGAVQGIPVSPCEGAAIATLPVDDGDRTMAIRWRERVLAEKAPDTGDTGDTGGDDSGTTTDDSGKETKDSPPPIDAGRNDAYGDDYPVSGCGCASGRSQAIAVWILLGLPWLVRRRSAR